MKNRVWQAIVVIILLVVLSRTALQRDLQASAFEEKINQSLPHILLPTARNFQENGTPRSPEIIPPLADTHFPETG